MKQTRYENLSFIVDNRTLIAHASTDKEMNATFSRACACTHIMDNQVMGPHAQYFLLQMFFVSDLLLCVGCMQDTLDVEHGCRLSCKE